ncbi:MAG: ATP-binding protein [Nostocaceae cyanobacterium]|nr:ATP-binding protein [Nostocaceae cyanobacterium]
MSILNYPLSEFITRVPSCPTTTTVAAVLAIFSQQKCDRLVVLNEQGLPLGLLRSAGILPQLLTGIGTPSASQLLESQQPVLTWGEDIIESIEILPDSWCIEQFSLFLPSQYNCENNPLNLNWALIDGDRKFVGLLDSSRLLQFLAQQKAKINSGNKKPSSHKATRKSLKSNNSPKGNVGENADATLTPNYPPSWTAKENYSLEYKALIGLLERLPWPLMLQTATGTIVAQNPAWWQQLGTLKDPEAISKQVNAILSLQKAVQPDIIITRGNGHGWKNSPLQTEFGGGNSTLAVNSPVLTDKLPEKLGGGEKVSTPSSRCFLDNRQPGSCTCVVEMQNGQERIWQFAKIPLDSLHINLQPNSHTSASNDLWLMLATDVTEQQLLCKELAAKNADLIQLNRLKDEFLACISHELKTPLTAVLGLSRLLVNQQLGELNERQARYAGLIHQSGRHLMSVVNDILDLTRMETGQMELTLSVVNIRTVCERAYTDAQALYTQNNKTPTTSPDSQTTAVEHQYHLAIEPGLEGMVADELRLRQMLVHLLANAFKFTATGGQLGLRVNRWEGWIAFTVWDTGIGIPEHQQHLIFQKFQQLENPLTRQFEGTGLGLVLTRALARLHGGDVSFLSREGKGSQFTLLLPPSPPKTSFGETDLEKWTEVEIGRLGDWEDMVVNSVPHPSTTPSPHYSHRSQRLVLVVEAVSRYIEALTEQLTGLGYQAVIARSGTEAVEKARRLQPQTIFLNPLLPLLSGWDVLTLIKSDQATRHIPVIVTATSAEKEQAFANRADGFLNLPVQYRKLAGILDNLFITPEAKQQEQSTCDTTTINNPLRILRLVNCALELHNPIPILRGQRVIEADDLEQAELLARVWKFDVVLLDTQMPNPQPYLEKFSQYPRLKNLPLVICDVAIIQAASQIPGLAVFPCLTPLEDGNTNALLSVLEIAAGRCCPPNIFVVNLPDLPDLPGVKQKRTKINGNIAQLKNPPAIARGSEWFQAWIQYLQTAGFKATMGRSWAEMLQQIRHQSVDLMLLCLTESILTKEILAALKALAQLSGKLPPILILVSESNNDSQVEIPHKQSQKKLSDNLGAIASVIGNSTTQILPRSISMEELLKHINQALSS